MTSVIDFMSECIRLIIDRLLLSPHFDFASTCKRFAAASQYILQCHQEAHDKIQIASDRDLTTVPLLLQSTFGKDLRAWHVRPFEVWRDRTSWHKWEAYSLYTLIIDGLDGAVSHLGIPNH